MEIRINEPMKMHTSFRAGGPAAWYAEPETAEELGALVSLFQKAGLPWYIVGNGSNLLVSDQGYPGLIISTSRFDRLETEGEILRAGSGVLLSKAASLALKCGLTGLEFAAGIPGTVGGACVMNAGAYGSETKDVLLSATVLTPEGQIKRIPAEELELGYRTSCIPGNGYVVLEAEYALKRGEPEAIKARMDELSAKRREKQPLEYPSAGSTFKRPEGYFAGKLIMDAGLRGFTVGGAQVSEKHCGFVINRGNASAEDVRSLIFQVQDRVYRQFGVKLEPEVRFLGEFEDTGEKSVVSRG